ncbi:MAG: penicillin-binding protein 2 [Acidimicrobiia bacterium]|nr:penicillin-binding protein 2 [Acidimicrobiia bacterium]
MGRRPWVSPDARLVAIGLALLLAWTAIGLRLFHIQGAAAEEYAARGVDQRLRTEVLAADRGTIFDRDGHELAVTVDAITVYANPRQVVDPVQTARAIGPYVGMDPGLLTGLLRKDAGFVYIARQLERRKAEPLRDLELPGIYFTEEPARTYPSGPLAASVIGFVQTDDNQGLEGVEFAFDEVLTGVPGQLVVERDAAGRVIPLGEYQVIPAEPGGDVILTIDREIQFETEQVLAETVERFGALGGTAVVLDPSTGEVLAMANFPTFDPNSRANYEFGTYRNRAVTDVYEPGSTQKLITVAAAIEESVVRPADIYKVPVELPIHDTTYSDEATEARAMTVSDIVAYSSNVGTILIQADLGNEALYRYIAAFGLGRAPGTGFPGETAGVLHPVDEWCVATCGPSTAIGYGVSVSALQMAAAFGVVANNGVLVQPRLVREVVAADGSRLPSVQIERTAVSARTAAEMRLMLAGVVEKGTGRQAAVAGYRVGGKTGTTRKYDETVGDYGDNVISSFIGIAPIENPRLVVAVVIDSPAGGEFGGQVAAPAFSQIALSALHQLGVPPNGE